MIAVELHNLTVSYRRHPAIHHIRGRFDAGTLTAILGPNGAGKSTLLKTIAGLQQAESGAVRLSGGNTRDIAYLPQQAQIDRAFPLSVLELVLLGGWRTFGWWRGVHHNTLARARDALLRVGLAGFEQRDIGSLSIGQFQRVLFARLMVQDARLILLDEPFAALDHATTQDLLGVMHQWHAEGRTIIAVIHDHQQVAQHFPHTLLLARELITWGKSAEVLQAHHLNRARHMSEAWNEQAPVCHQ